VSNIWRHAATCVVAMLMALVFAGAALAWSDWYVGEKESGPETFFGGDQDNSGFNFGLDGNVVYWTSPWGGTPNLGSRYIDSSGVGINSFDFRGSSFIDWRTLGGGTYGAAQCRASNANDYPALVSQCYTDN
jgi:hypothetical protein